jgi:hypothetical protein
MNLRSEFKALKDWKHLGLNSLTLTLTPALSPRGWTLPTSQTAGHRRCSKRLQYRAKVRSQPRGYARIPTGFRPPAQQWCCEARATLGHRPASRSNRNAVAAAFSFLAPNVCHNPVGVDPALSSFTQGRLADSPTLGFEAQSLWDWRDSRALTPEPRPGVQRRDLWNMLSPRGGRIHFRESAICLRQIHHGSGVQCANGFGEFCPRGRLR